MYVHFHDTIHMVLMHVAVSACHAELSLNDNNYFNPRVLHLSCIVYTPIWDGAGTLSPLASRFYSAMHFSAKRGIAIVYCPSVRLSVCPCVTFRYTVIT